MLLAGRQAKRYEDVPCDARGPIERRFWALARPFYALDGNDLRTEHFARLTTSRLLRDARMPYAMSWGDDVNELLVRYGWSTRWARREPSMSDPTGIHVVGFEPSPAFEFAPTDAAFFDPAEAGEDGWNLRNRTAQARYAPDYAKSLIRLPHQLAYFRRGDSAIVIAAFDVREDTAFGRDSLRAAVAVIADSTDSATVMHVDRAGPIERMRLDARWVPGVVSLELVDRARRRVARARYAADPSPSDGDTELEMSDLLLLDATDSLPDQLDAVVPLVRGGERARATERIAVYWEVYGIRATADTLRYSVTVVPSGESWFKRAARRVGIGERPAPLHMRWEEPIAGAPIVSRTLALDLSALKEGRYVLEVSIDGRASTRRGIEIVR
jgi:hypothetical protein